MALSPDTETAICERISNGESLRKICLDESMPARSVVMKWLNENSAFADQYARAREVQADYLAEQCVDIADEDPASFIKTESESEIRCLDGAAVAHQRLRIDARKWFASKVAPKKYGEKLELAGDEKRPLIEKVVLEVVYPKATNG